MSNFLLADLIVNGSAVIILGGVAWYYFRFRWPNRSLDAGKNLVIRRVISTGVILFVLEQIVRRVAFHQGS